MQYGEVTIGGRYATTLRSDDHGAHTGMGMRRAATPRSPAMPPFCRFFDCLAVSAASGAAHWEPAGEPQSQELRTIAPAHSSRRMALQEWTGFGSSACTLCMVGATAACPMQRPWAGRSLPGSRLVAPGLAGRWLLTADGERMGGDVFCKRKRLVSARCCTPVACFGTGKVSALPRRRTHCFQSESTSDGVTTAVHAFVSFFTSFVGFFTIGHEQNSMLLSQCYHAQELLLSCTSNVDAMRAWRALLCGFPQPVWAASLFQQQAIPHPCWIC